MGLRSNSYYRITQPDESEIIQKTKEHLLSEQDQKVLDKQGWIIRQDMRRRRIAMSSLNERKNTKTQFGTVSQAELLYKLARFMVKEGLA
jgi:hypothetical protein